MDLRGRVLGRHGGIINFTIGQRRGLGIATGEPLYVVRLEPETRRVVVGAERDLWRDRLMVREVNWLGGAPLSSTGVPVSVKLRSTQSPAPATIFKRGDGPVEVILDEPRAAIAPGQACVFYDGDRLLGGGWICREEKLA